MPGPRRRITPRRRSAGGSKIATTYYRSAAAAPSSPFKKTSQTPSQLKKIGWLLVNIVITVVILLTIIYSLIVKPSAKVVADSQVYHPVGVYRALASSKLKSLKNNNKISFDEQSIITTLQTKFPEIAKASLELPIFSPTPIIHLNISPPSIFLNDDQKTYIVNEEGVAVAPAAEVPKIKDLPTLLDHSGFRAAAGKQVISADGVAFIKALTAQCTRQAVPIQSLELPPQVQEINLRTADRGYYIKFFLGGDPLRQIGQFLAARHQFDVSGNQPGEYLDVRVAGKVYYK